MYAEFIQSTDPGDKPSTLGTNVVLLEGDVKYYKCYYQHTVWWEHFLFNTGDIYYLSQIIVRLETGKSQKDLYEVKKPPRIGLWAYDGEFVHTALHYSDYTQDILYWWGTETDFHEWIPHMNSLLCYQKGPFSVNESGRKPRKEKRCFPIQSNYRLCPGGRPNLIWATRVYM